MNGQRVESGACPRPIEVALPIREISAEGVRDKNIHHAHVSHLHIWWARRPPRRRAQSSSPPSSLMLTIRNVRRTSKRR